MSEDQGTILIIEDDPRMQKVLHRIFHDEGYQVEVASDGKAGVDAFLAHQPSAVVLDLILPQMSGREVCKRIKTVSPDTPVLILSAVSEVVDKVLLLELGAEDYVTKPFSPRELLARVQASIRRRRKSDPVATYRFGDCEIDFLKMIARKSGKVISLTAHEFKLLRFFTENPERVLSRDELLAMCGAITPTRRLEPSTTRYSSCGKSSNRTRRVHGIYRLSMAPATNLLPEEPATSCRHSVVSEPAYCLSRR